MKAVAKEENEKENAKCRKGQSEGEEESQMKRGRTI